MKRTLCRRNDGRRGCVDGRPCEAPGARRGFTLLEIVLALVLVALLAGVMVLNLPGLAGGRRLEQTAERFQTALRLARADAANRGRRLRLTFGDETGAPAVSWEPDPLEAPGEFVDYSTRCTWRHLLEAEGVWIQRCVYTGASAYRYVLDATGTGDTVSESDLATLTFEPDGSCDSAVLHLVLAEDPEGRVARIELGGITGRVTAEVLTPEELAEREAEEEATEK